MKLYLVAPVVPQGSDEKTIDERLAACIEPIADLILSHLLADPALFGIRHEFEGTAAPLPMTKKYGYADVVELDEPEALRSALVACGDPNSGKWMLIRSLVTCRAVLYGYDGQAFVCLPHGAPPIQSTDPAIIEVSDRSSMLVDTDWMDGLRPD